MEHGGDSSGQGPGPPDAIDAKISWNGPGPAAESPLRAGMIHHSSPHQQRTSSSATAAAGAIDGWTSQRSPPSGIAVVSITGGHGHSQQPEPSGSTPRPASRLRYSVATSSSREAATLPEFIRLEEAPPRAGSAGAGAGALDNEVREEVEITHVPGSEAKQREELQGKVISQVDALVAYFNSIYADDQLDISELEHELAARNVELEARAAVIQQLLAARQRGPGLRAALSHSLRRHPCRWIFALLLLLGVALSVGVPVSRALRPPLPPSPPGFASAPRLVSASNVSLDVGTALDAPGWLHYVLIPVAADVGWHTHSSNDITVAAIGSSNTPLEASAVACGSLFLANGGVGTAEVMLSVGGAERSRECEAQHAAAAAGGRRASCERCPLLQPDTQYGVLLVAAAPSGPPGTPVAMTAATLPSSASAAPRLRASAAAATVLPPPSRAGGVPAAAAARPDAGEGFSLRVSLSDAGSVRFLVVHDSLYGRFSERYVSFDNAPALDIASALVMPREAFHSGLIARGRISLPSGGVEHVCTIGADGSSSACKCEPPASACEQEVGCFGQLCEYSRSALTPNVTYKVLLVPASLDGRDLGPVAMLGPLTTRPPELPPLPGIGLGISSLIGPDRFTVANISQDRLGFVRIFVTQPLPPVQAISLRRSGGSDGPGLDAAAAQVHAQVPLAGTATRFISGPPGVAVPPARRRNLLADRKLAGASLLLLPPVEPSRGDGTLFLPPCARQLDCASLRNADVAAYVNPALQHLVQSACVAVPSITAPGLDVVVSSLTNDTTYHVTLVLSDLYGNEGIWSALVHTQDMTPPVLTVVSAPPPDFASFAVTLRLNEPGAIHAGLLPASTEDAGNAAPTPRCPPDFEGTTVIAQTSTTVPAAGADVDLAFTEGLKPNSAYVLRLIAADAAGNCQQNFTDVNVRTLDNVPPVILDLRIGELGGHHAQLLLSLDEPGAAAYAVLRADGASPPVCPSTEAVRSSAGSVNMLFAGAAPGAVALGNVSVVAAHTLAAANVTGLSSEEHYRICAAAEDTTRLRNRQSTPSHVDFATLDVTAPRLDVAVLSGHDGNFTCERSGNYSCSMTFSTSLSEPGEIVWLLLPAGSAGNGSVLPLPPQPHELLRGGSNNSSGGRGADALATGRLGAAAANTTVQGLASDTDYLLAFAAVDTAAPSPNLVPELVVLPLTAPDVTPPVFKSVSMAAAADTNMTINVTLNEAARVFFALTEHASPAAAPSPADVAAAVAGVDGSDIKPQQLPFVAAGSSDAPRPGSAVLLTAAGLKPGTLYDAFFFAVDDPAGNNQTTVTNLTRLRTPDSAPPSIRELAASFTPPMSLRLRVRTSKPGRLVYAARRAAEPPPSAAELLAAWEDGQASANAANPAANFTGELALPTAEQDVAARICVVDGDAFVLHAVAQDGEGAWPGRTNNTSPVFSAPVTLVLPDDGASCIPSVFLAPLQPVLSFARATAVPARLGGLLLGPRTLNATPNGVSWSQLSLGLLDTSALEGPRRLIAHVGGVRLPGSIDIPLRGHPPAAVTLRVRSSVLIPDANGPEGATLRLSYQLSDAEGCNIVNTEDLSLRPVLSYAPGALPPPSAPGANTSLTACDIASLDATSGIGECDVAVPTKLFPEPGAGSLGAAVALRALIKGAPVAVSPLVTLRLQAPPAPPAFAPGAPGLLFTMPYRAVRPGEALRVSVVAVNPLPTGITGFTLALRYDTARLAFVSAIAPAGLWLSPAVGLRPGPGNYGELEVSSAGRALGSDAAVFRSSSSIPLLELTFRIPQSAPPGAALAALTVAPGGAGCVLSPGWPAPAVQFNSYSGGGAAGALMVEPTTTLGAWAWADAAELFNTAALDGREVAVRVRGTLVRSGSGAAPPGGSDTVSGCALLNIAGGGSNGTTTHVPAPAPATITLEGGACVVRVNAINAGPARGMRVAVSLLSGEGGESDQTAETRINVWYPSNVSMSIDDAVLNSVLPINAAPPSSGCLDGFQSARLSATADWSDGASVLHNADVTALLSYVSSDPNVAQVVQGAIVKGVRPGRARITAPALPGAVGVDVAVVPEPVCLEQLTPLATTGPGYAQLLHPQPKLRPGEPTQVAWDARQALTWEGSSALVLSLARFSDGTVMDVSGRSSVEALATAAALPSSPPLLEQTAPAPAQVVVPFVLGSDASSQLPLLTINATVGAAVTCSAQLQASWSVCSLPLGSGSGRVRVSLPNAVGVAAFAASPATITSSNSVASQAPVGLPTSALLSLVIMFSDGIERDFSADWRVRYAITVGAALCAVDSGKGASSQPRVFARGGSAAYGSCTVTASVSFPNASKPDGAITFTASAEVQVVVATSLALAALPANAVSLQLPLPPAQPMASEGVTLLKCDGRNYEQITVWPLAVLSNCSKDGGSCPLVDVGSAAFTKLASSDDTVTAVMAGYPAPLTGYPTNPLLGNRLVPVSAGNATVTATLLNTSTHVSPLSHSLTIAVRDTYQPGWPAAAPAPGLDGTALVTANMSGPGLHVTYRIVPSATLDLLAAPPVAADIARMGVSLARHADSGAHFLAATVAGLEPGTNYTVLAVAGMGDVLSPGVWALSGLLLPDTSPPSFTRARLVTAALLPGQPGRWALSLELALDEAGRVLIAVYGDPACITADPTPAEVAAGVNLADVGKCNCSARYCAPAVTGSFMISNSSAAETVTLNAALPPFPFADGPGEAACTEYAPLALSSPRHAVYLIAQDDLPTFKGWNSSCVTPSFDQNVPPGPCAPLTLGHCHNTPPAAESVNVQALPYADAGELAGDGSSSSQGRAAPLWRARAPLRSVVTLADPVPPGFVSASLNSTGASLVFSFVVSKPGLVRWRLVEQVKHEIAYGHTAVWDVSEHHTGGGSGGSSARSIAVSRKCGGEQLVPGTSYALWYTLTDIFGATSDILILKAVL